MTTKVRMGRAALVVVLASVVGCSQSFSSETGAIASRSEPLSGAAAADLNLGATQVAAFNPSVAAGECTGPNSTVVKCWMAAYVNATKASPTAPTIPGLVVGKRIGTGGVVAAADYDTQHRRTEHLVLRRNGGRRLRDRRVHQLHPARHVCSGYDRRRKRL
ncbi:hypothetical protein BH09MYX1_BH09MYX1_63480 [soil metagenome]